MRLHFPAALILGAAILLRSSASSMPLWEDEQLDMGVDVDFVAPTATPTALSHQDRGIWTKRQTTRTAVISRAVIRQNRRRVTELRQRAVKDAKETQTVNTRTRVMEPRASPEPAHDGKLPSSRYPTCSDSNGGVKGYARYPQWDLYGDDVPGNPRYTDPSDRSEGACAALCDSIAECVGYVYLKGDPCYLKGVNTARGKFQPTTHGAGTFLAFMGKCSDWASTVPSEADAVCCDS